MVFYFYSSLPIIESRSSIVCPLTGENRISTVRLHRGTHLTIRSLFVPIGRLVYPSNILSHSNYVKTQLEDSGGYKTLSNESFTVKRFRRNWSISAKNGSKINFATGQIETTMSIANPTLDIAMMPGYDVFSIDGEAALYVNTTDNFKWKKEIATHERY